MKRSGGITASAVIAIVGSIGSILMGGLMVMSAFMTHLTPIPPSDPALPVPPIDPMLVLGFMAVLYVAFGAWGIVSAIGLLRLRNWARVCFAVYGGLLGVLSVFGVLGIALAAFIVPQTLPPDVAQPGFMEAMFAILAVFALLGIALGVWWVIYFNRLQVKIQFLGEQVAAAPRQFPLSISIIAWILAVGGAATLPYVMLSFPAFVSGFVLRGAAARIIFFLFAIVSLLSGVGMLRKRVYAHSLAVGYFVLVLLNMAATVLIPGSQARMQEYLNEMGRGQLIPISMNAFLAISILSGLLIGGTGLWFLMRGRQPFIEACSK